MWKSIIYIYSYQRVFYNYPNNRVEKNKTKHKWNREKWQHKMCHPTYTIKPINCRPRKKEHPINYKFYRIAKNK